MPLGIVTQNVHKVITTRPAITMATVQRDVSHAKNVLCFRIKECFLYNSILGILRYRVPFPHVPSTSLL